MKVELNQVFTVEKGNRKARWKVIEHPYFPGCLTLVHDYSGLHGRMSSELRESDYEHMGGSTTLETAYNDAYMYT